MSGRSVATAEGYELRGETTPPLSLLREMWRARSLIAMLARKDFYVRYRRASFGLLWAVGLPLMQAAVLSIVFSRVVRIEVGVSYAVFVFSGMVGWSYFTGTLGASSTAIVDGSALGSRIYFPRAVLPIVPVAANLYGFVINVAVLILMALAFGVGLDVEVLLLVPAIALGVLLATAFALLTSSVHVYFRDTRYIVQAALTAWFYVTPVLYPVRKAPGALQVVVKANPVTGVVELFRAATVGADPGWLGMVGVTCIWVAVIGTIGVALQCRYNRVFVDLL